jgi:hypothetical protein
MKKTISFVIAILIFNTSIMLSGNAQTYNTEQRSKAIHVVFDDSISMITNDSVTFFDRWGQAKYAMEVFAAMLEERDVMNIYFMSDFMNNPNASAGLTVFGHEDAKERVRRVHEHIPNAWGTPFDPVIKAYNDLMASDADEKWLVILADGGFNRLNGAGISFESIDVNGRLTGYASESDINIFFLVIGEDDDLIKMMETINGNPGIGFYFDHARNTNEILGKITAMCNRIFNRNNLSFTNVARREFSFDIPMMELLVFAQGADVRINGISGDATYQPDEDVRVKYSEVASTNPNFDASNPSIIISRELAGAIAIFRDIPKGSYSLDITGAQTVEIYYKPEVNLGIELFQNGEKVITQNITEGEYQIRFGIINEEGGFFTSSLLGNVEYEAVITNNGQTVSIKSGDNINLECGDYEIHITARFLDINTAENIIRGRVLLPPIPLDVEIKAPNDSYSITELKNSSAFIITVRNEGELLSEAQWLSMPLPHISSDANIKITDVKRGSNVSTFEFSIRRMDGEANNTSTGNITFNIFAEFVYDEQPYRGMGVIAINIRAPVIQIDVAAPRNEMTVTNLNDSEAFIITIKQDGNLLTEEQWLNMALPTVATNDRITITEARHGAEISTFEFYIRQNDDNRHETSSGEIVIGISAELEVDGILLGGDESVTVEIKDDISFFDKFLYWFKNWWWLLLLIFIILGYTPLFKKYLPKSLKKSPEIKCKPLKSTPKLVTFKGKYKRNQYIRFFHTSQSVVRLNLFHQA